MVRGGGVGDFFFNDTATTEIYTLSLHDALLISKAKTRGSDPKKGGCWSSEYPLLAKGKFGRPRIQIGRAHV